MRLVFWFGACALGGAAAKWAKAWTGLGLHIYGWVDAYWPHTSPPSTYGLDKPGTPFLTVVKSFWDTGYAGALGWQYIEAAAAELDAVKTFADSRACQTAYSSPAMDVGLPERSRRSAPSAPDRRCRVVAGRALCGSLP